MGKEDLNLKIKVLVCPLDWGLGHATRCVPIIEKLIDKDAEVIIAADKGPYAFLKREFPGLKYIRFPSFPIIYPERGSMVLKMLSSLPSIIKGIYAEHVLLDKIIKENNVDAVISDNRYGLWNKNIYSVFITHQVLVKCPVYLKLLEPLLYFINRYFIKQYNECWIPDTDKETNLSGELSHKYKLPENAYYINPLSRFQKYLTPTRIQKSINNAKKADLLIILSGPEPQRTILENKIINQLTIDNGKWKMNSEFRVKRVVILKGKAEENEEIIINENITLYSHLESEKFFDLINSSEIIICRPGYSTIMDLAVTGKKAIFIPTPGQTEQEYLAEYLKKKKMFYYEKQNDFSIIRAIEESKFYNGINILADNHLLCERIEKIIDLSILKHNS